MSTTKVTRKLCAQLQSGSTYESGGMYAMPFTSETISQKYDPIEDNSIDGSAFKNIPAQGPRHVEGTVQQNFDEIASEIILEAAFGANSSGVFTLGSNSKKLSMCSLNSANAIEYANAYIKRLAINGAAGELITMEYDILGVTAQDRDVIGNYPSVTAYGDPFTFHQGGGANGYVRVGDATDALDSGDNIQISDFSLELVTGFDAQYCNDGVGTLTPAFGMVPPECSGSFKIARHSSDAFQDFEDAHTPLQMAIYVYASATQTLLIEIPRFVISVNISDEDIAQQEIEMHIGRNGTGTSYKNTNMSFTSPIRITVVNS